MSSTPSRFRGIVIRLTVLCFAVSALMGIAVLVRGGEIGELEGKVLVTTLLVGVVSAAVLCYVTPRARLLGGLGGVVVLVPLVTALLLIWGEDEPFPRSPEVLATGALLASLLAQVCLLWSLVGRAGGRSGVVRFGLAPTIVAAVALVVLWLPVIWRGIDFAPGDWYYRLMGVVAILDVLGTVVIPAVVLLRGRTARPVSWVDARPVEPHRLPEELWAEVEEVAYASDRTTDDVIREAVRRHREDLVAAGAIREPSDGEFGHDLERPARGE